jgi:arylsulfatase A-like enzyme
MKYTKLSISMAVLLTVSVAAVLHAQTKPKNTRPNVVIIYTDDQGTLDLNIYGAKDLATPNLDRPARTGTRFTQFYAASLICSPSRASLPLY